MKVYPRHIIHTVVHGSEKTKKALLVLYKHHKLVGSMGHAGILLVKKIKSNCTFSSADWYTAKRVITSHAIPLAELSNQGLFKIK